MTPGSFGDSPREARTLFVAKLNLADSCGLRVTNQVTNDDGGTRTANDFKLRIDGFEP